MSQENSPGYEDNDYKRKRDDDQDFTSDKRARFDTTFKCVVRNLSYDADESEIRGMFEECGTVQDFNFPRDFRNGTNQSRGYCFVKFEDEESFQRAIDKYNDYEYKGRPLRVEQATSTPRNAPRGGEESLEVFVGNVSVDAGNNDLEDKFASCGRVVEVRLPHNEFQKPKGFAFIRFEDSEAIEKALRMDGEDLLGQPIRVSEARPKRPREPYAPRGGGYGGDRGGGYRGGYGGGRGGGYGGGYGGDRRNDSYGGGGGYGGGDRRPRFRDDRPRSSSPRGGSYDRR